MLDVERSRITDCILGQTDAQSFACEIGGVAAKVKSDSCECRVKTCLCRAIKSWSTRSPHVARQGSRSLSPSSSYPC